MLGMLTVEHNVQGIGAASLRMDEHSPRGPRPHGEKTELAPRRGGSRDILSGAVWRDTTHLQDILSQIRRAHARLVAEAAQKNADFAREARDIHERLCALRERAEQQAAQAAACFERSERAIGELRARHERVLADVSAAISRLNGGVPASAFSEPSSAAASMQPLGVPLIAQPIAATALPAATTALPEASAAPIEVFARPLIVVVEEPDDGFAPLTPAIRTSGAVDATAGTIRT